MIMGCTVALQCNPTWVLGQFELRNAHTDCSRGLIWHELEADVYFHFLMHIFICMYGDTSTPQRHFGNGPDQLPTSIHWSREGLRQGETAANVFFNILAARIYIAFTKILNGRGILLGLVDDCNILGPPEVLEEVVQQLPALAMLEAGLTSQGAKQKSTCTTPPEPHRSLTSKSAPEAQTHRHSRYTTSLMDD